MKAPRALRTGRALTIGAVVAVMLGATFGASAEAATPASNATGINIQFPATRVAITGRLTAAHGGGPVANATVIALNSRGVARATP